LVVVFARGDSVAATCRDNVSWARRRRADAPMQIDSTQNTADMKRFARLWDGIDSLITFAIKLYSRDYCLADSSIVRGKNIAHD
jgi:hypothetical protein